MKRILSLSFLMAATLAIDTVVFSSCSQDEAEDTNQAKVELLKAKAAEFAKMYGVQMSLNEENIEQIAETLTVEQMEQDFQAFANRKEVVHVNSEKAQPRTRGLKIMRTKEIAETPQPSSGGGLANIGKVYKGEVSDVASTRFMNGLHYCQFNFSVNVKWEYSLQSSNRNIVDVTIKELNNAEVDKSKVVGYIYIPGIMTRETELKPMAQSTYL